MKRRDVIIGGAAIAVASPALAGVETAADEIKTSEDLCEIFFKIAHSDFAHTGRFPTSDIARQRLYDAWVWSKGRIAGNAGLPVSYDPAVPSQPDDIEVLRRCAAFWAALDNEDRAHRAHSEVRDRIEAQPGFPDLWAENASESLERIKADQRKREALFAAGGIDPLYDAWNDASEQTGEALCAAFEIPATTPAGILAKARILARVYQGYDFEADHDLTCYEPDKNRAAWFGSMLADLERLSGRAGS